MVCELMRWCKMVERRLIEERVDIVITVVIMIFFHPFMIKNIKRMRLNRVYNSWMTICPVTFSASEDEGTFLLHQRIRKLRSGRFGIQNSQRLMQTNLECSRKYTGNLEQMSRVSTRRKGQFDWKFITANNSPNWIDVKLGVMRSVGPVRRLRWDAGAVLSTRCRELTCRQCHAK